MLPLNLSERQVMGKLQRSVRNFTSSRSSLLAHEVSRVSRQQQAKEESYCCLYLTFSPVRFSALRILPVKFHRQTKYTSAGKRNSVATTKDPLPGFVKLSLPNYIHPTLRELFLNHMQKTYCTVLSCSEGFTVFTTQSHRQLARSVLARHYQISHSKSLLRKWVGPARQSAIIIICACALCCYGTALLS